MTKKTETPANILKRINRKAGRAAADAYDDGYPHYAEPADQVGPSTPEDMLASTSVSTILAISMLHGTLPAKVITRIQSPPSLALVVAVPGSDWIGPIAHALSSCRAWTEILKRSGASKVSDKSSVGSDSVAAALGAGRSVVGVSTSPDRYLPAALLTAADLRIELKPPTPRVIRATIRLATGQRAGHVPADILLGLGFDEITSCIRKGSTPRECVRRLKAASLSKRAAASDMAEVPLLKDTVGYGPAKVHGQLLIDAVEAYRRGERSWSSIEGRNIIVSGPPGTGKTTYARSLAKSLGVPLTATSVSSWFAQTAGYLNDICRKVDEVFLEASQNGGVLLIDELDSLPNRNDCDSRHRDYWVTVVNHVLMTLDGAVSSPASRLIVIGATNYPDRLDPALVRPGRLDRIVHIELPDAVATEGILRQHLRGALVDQDLHPVAAIGVGATGADIAGWAAGARMTALAARRPMVMADLIGRIAPPETRSPEIQLSVARHEAGHAALVSFQGMGEVTTVSLIAKGSFSGWTTSSFGDLSTMDTEQIDSLVVSIMAGRAADEHWGRATSGSAGGSRSDLAHATALVASKHASWGLGNSLLYRGDQAEALALIKFDVKFKQVVEADLARLYAVAQDLIAQNANRIDRIARRLVERRVLSGHEVRAILAEPLDGDSVRPTDMGGRHDRG